MTVRVAGTGRGRTLPTPASSRIGAKARARPRSAPWMARRGSARVEREVAVLAAEGHSSREIVARLHLSVRTVDNHLHRVYTKLGVGGRDGLDRALKRD